MIDPQKLIGSWELVRWETTYDDGRTIYPMGEDAKGYVLYTTDGRMSAVLFKADRTAFTSGEALTADDDEKVAAWNSYFSYGGPYRLEGDKVIHTVEHAMYPNWLGQEQVRDVTFDGDHLILATQPQKTRRGTQTSRVVWAAPSPDNPAGRP